MVQYAHLACPNCRRELRVRVQYNGRKIGCNFCDHIFRVEFPDPPEPDASAAEPGLLSATPPSAPAPNPAATLKPPQEEMRVDIDELFRKFQSPPPPRAPAPAPVTDVPEPVLQSPAQPPRATTSVPAPAATAELTLPVETEEPEPAAEQLASASVVATVDQDQSISDAARSALRAEWEREHETATREREDRLRDDLRRQANEELAEADLAFAAERLRWESRAEQFRRDAEVHTRELERLQAEAEQHAELLKRHEDDRKQLSAHLDELQAHLTDAGRLEADRAAEHQERLAELERAHRLELEALDERLREELRRHAAEELETAGHNFELERNSLRNANAQLCGENADLRGQAGAAAEESARLRAELEQLTAEHALLSGRLESDESRQSASAQLESALEQSRRLQNDVASAQAALATAQATAQAEMATARDTWQAQQHELAAEAAAAHETALRDLEQRLRAELTRSGALELEAARQEFDRRLEAANARAEQRESELREAQAALAAAEADFSQERDALQVEGHALAAETAAAHETALRNLEQGLRVELTQAGALELEAAQREFDRRHSALKAEAEQLESEREAARGELAALQARFEQLEQELAEKSADCVQTGELLAASEGRQADRDLLETELQCALCTVDELRAELDQRAAAQTSGVEQGAAEGARLRADNQHLQSELEELRKNFAAVRAQLADSGSAGVRLEELLKEAGSLHERIEELTAERQAALEAAERNALRVSEAEAALAAASDAIEAEQAAWQAQAAEERAEFQRAHRAEFEELTATLRGEFEQTLAAELAESRSAAEAATRQAESLARELESRESALAQEEDACRTLVDELCALERRQTKFDHLQSELAAALTGAQFGFARAESAERALAEVEARFAADRTAWDDSRRSLPTAKDLQEKDAELSALEQRLQAALEEAGELRSRLASALHDLAAASQPALDATPAHDANELLNRIADMQLEIEGLRRERQQLQAELTGISARFDATLAEQRHFEPLAAELETLRSICARAESERQIALATAEQQRSWRAESEKRLQALTKKFEAERQQWEIERNSWNSGRGTFVRNGQDAPDADDLEESANLGRGVSDTIADDLARPTARGVREEPDSRAIPASDDDVLASTQPALPVAHSPLEKKNGSSKRAVVPSAVLAVEDESLTQVFADFGQLKLQPRRDAGRAALPVPDEAEEVMILTGKECRRCHGGLVVPVSYRLREYPLALCLLRPCLCRNCGQRQMRSMF